MANRGLNFRFFLSSGILLALAAVLLLAKAKADSFNFSGTLASAVHGSTSITGAFTFTSASGGSVPSFDFITPGGTLTNLNSTVSSR